MSPDGAREGAVRQPPPGQLLVHVAIEREAGLLDEAQGGNRGHELGKRMA